eukprot:13368930-Alexandrium_andersonii.AAC.1
MLRATGSARTCGRFPCAALASPTSEWPTGSPRRSDVGARRPPPWTRPRSRATSLGSPPARPRKGER